MQLIYSKKCINIKHAKIKYPQRQMSKLRHFVVIEQKGMTFDHDFGYSFSFFSSLLKKERREKENEVAKIVNKSHALLLDL